MSKSLPYSSSPNISAGLVKTDPQPVEFTVVDETPVVVPEPVVEETVEEEKKTIKKKA